MDSLVSMKDRGPVTSYKSKWKCSKIIWKSVGSQAVPRHSQRTKQALLRVFAQGQTWQGLGWGWDQVPEGIKVSVPGNLSFPSEERRSIHSKAAAPQSEAPELACVPLVQNGFISFLLTSAHCLYSAMSHLLPTNWIEDALLNKLVWHKDTALQDFLSPVFLSPLLSELLCT